MADVVGVELREVGVVGSFACRVRVLQLPKKVFLRLLGFGLLLCALRFGDRRLFPSRQKVRRLLVVLKRKVSAHAGFFRVIRLIIV